MKVSSIPVAQAVVEALAGFDIQDIVISPGSRNAPITLGLTSHPYFKTYSTVDERSAGFFALGMAQQHQKPVALLCTSGSALLNYYPAVAEAFYSDIPLVVLSADRPSYRIDIGDGQTLRQDGVFERMLIDQAHLQQDVSHATDTILQSNRQTIIAEGLDKDGLGELQKGVDQNNKKQLEKVLTAAIIQKGPVHINIPMEEPLYEYREASSDLPVNPVKVPGKTQDISLSEMHRIWKEANSVLVLAGCASPDVLSKESQNNLAADGRVVVLTEITSNLSHSDFYAHIDQLIAPVEDLPNATAHFASLQPDLLVTFGGMIVSKKVKSFLRNHPPKKHLHIDPKKAYDTYYADVEHVKCLPNQFFQKISVDSNEDNSYKNRWKNLSEIRRSSHHNFFQNAPFSDFKAIGTIMKSVPDNYHIQWANSTPIRYAMFFPVPKGSHSFCNRGTSGIEGSVSTAVGAAVASNRPTLLITGDLSFFYDANALWQSHLPNTLRIIVINNRGGGIFRILPGEKNTPTFQKYFETRHDLSVKHLARQHRCAYSKAKSLLGLHWKLRSFYKPSRRPKILEINTPSEINDKVLMEYFKALQ
ncbi:MAG: 2-succinyl-5-enolpyruvyl-6-hydroxy-3-cyclohexene-1-carboxylate synthase [Flavobacteriaceae bacterium]